MFGCESEKRALVVVCLVGAWIFMGAGLGAGAAAAQVPTTMNYQGRLLQNTADQDAVSGTVDIELSIWSGPASDGGATELWSESWTGVELSNGIFSVLLGSNGSPLDAADFQDDTSLYLQLEVDGETLLPRQQLGTAPFAFVDEPENELQDLVLAGNTLSLTDSSMTVDLSPYLDDMDDQTLALSGNTLSISGSGSSVDLSGYLDDTNTDSQALSLSGDTLTISGSGSTVDLGASDSVQNLDQQVTNLAGMFRRRVFVSSATYGGDLGGLDGADGECQTLADAASLGGTFMTWLSDSSDSPLTRFSRVGIFVRVDGTVVAESWSDLTDGALDAAIALTETGVGVGGEEVWTDTATDGSRAGSNDCGGWSTTAGSGVVGEADLAAGGWTQSGLGDCSTPRRLYCFEQSSFADSDDQRLTLIGDSLQLTSDDGVDTVDLSPYFDDTDAQTLSLSGSTLTISGSGSTVDLSSFLDDTDSQTLSLSGTTLTISGSGSTIDLSSFLDDTDSQTLSLSGTTLAISGSGSTVDLSGFTDTDEQTLSLSGNTLTISGSGSSVALGGYLDNTDSQQLSLSGTNLSVTGGNTVGLSSFLDNTDSQNLNNVLAQGTDANQRDITNLDQLYVDTVECDGCVDSADIEQDTILGNDITDRIFILHIDCNGSCANMSMKEACNVIENLRGLDFEVELMAVSCVYDVPSTTGNQFVPCDDGSEVFGDYECRAFELRTLGDIPCVNGEGTDAIVTCYETDIAK